MNKWWIETIQQLFVFACSFAAAYATVYALEITFWSVFAGCVVGVFSALVAGMGSDWVIKRLLT